MSTGGRREDIALTYNLFYYMRIKYIVNFQQGMLVWEVFGNMTRLFLTVCLLNVGLYKIHKDIELTEQYCLIKTLSFNFINDLGIIRWGQDKYNNSICFRAI